MAEDRVHQIIKANDDDLLKKMSDLIASHVSASMKRPADDSVREEDQNSRFSFGF